MGEKITYQYLREYIDKDGYLLHMASLIEIHGQQFIEVIENDIRYLPSELSIPPEPILTFPGFSPLSLN